MRDRRACAWLAGILAAGVVSATPAAAVSATGPSLGALVSSGPLTTVTDPGLTGFSHIVADAAHGHVFLSQGSDTVVVVDLDGTKVASIAGLPGSRGMGLSPDGDTLWVAVRSPNAIKAIDTATLAVAQTYPLAADVCPVSVAETAGSVWFAEACDFQHGGLRALDPTTGLVSGELDYAYNGQLVASPDLPGSLFAFPLGVSPSRLSAYTVVGGAVPMLTERAATDVGSNTGQVAVTPGGATIITASGSPYQHQVWSTADLSPVGTVVSDSYPTAVAVRADGMVAAGTDSRVFVYPAGASATLNTYPMDAGLYGSLQRGGLAFAGERLFAVAGSTTGGEKLVLHVVTPRRPSAVELRIDRTRTVAGRHVRLDLTLTPAAAERTVSVYRTVAGRPRELVTRVEVATSGRTPFRIEADRNARYVAEFGGDDVYERASDGVRLDVAPRLATKMLGYRAKRGGAYVYGPSHDAVIQAKVTPGHAGDCVVFRAQFRVAGAWGYDATTKCVKLNAASKARGALAGDRRLVGIPIRVRVEWRGDEENIKNRSAWRQVRFG